jgi:hypothetical protein
MKANVHSFSKGRKKREGSTRSVKYGECEPLIIIPVSLLIIIVFGINSFCVWIKYNLPFACRSTVSVLDSPFSGNVKYLIKIMNSFHFCFRMYLQVQILPTTNYVNRSKQIKRIRRMLSFPRTIHEREREDIHGSNLHVLVAKTAIMSTTKTKGKFQTK